MTKSTGTRDVHYWLMKAEPDSRIEKGKDVKFSIDDFETVKTTPWEGVRNHEAKNLMKEMRLGDKVLFYHSNCKPPGIAGFAEVSREVYPDYTAWDRSHPYYHAKSDPENPTWYMVDVTFSSRARHFVPLPILRNIADAAADSLPKEVSYIGADGHHAIKTMSLVNRGRLSVQSVTPAAWTAITLLAERGGWQDTPLASGSGASGNKKTSSTVKSKRATQAKKAGTDETEKYVILSSKGKKRKADDEGGGDGDDNDDREKPATSTTDAPGPRRSTRRKT